jgi:hypothetical protein
VHLSGGTDPFFLSAAGYPPGSILSGGELFLYSTVIWVGGSPLEFFFPGSGGIGFFPSITMPTDGKDFFRIFVDVSFFHTGINYDTGLTIDVSGGAYGSISFYRGADGYYYPDQFVQAPEPAKIHGVKDLRVLIAPMLLFPKIWQDKGGRGLPDTK